MTERVAKATADTANMRAGMRNAISGVQFAIGNVRKKLENIQTHVAHELHTAAPAMMQEFADKLLARMSDEIAIAVQDLTQRYRYEARQRKLLYNKLQELKGISFDLSEGTRRVDYNNCHYAHMCVDICTVCI